MVQYKNIISIAPCSKILKNKLKSCVPTSALDFQFHFSPKNSGDATVLLSMLVSFRLPFGVPFLFIALRDIFSQLKPMQKNLQRIFLLCHLYLHLDLFKSRQIFFQTLYQTIIS